MHCYLEVQLVRANCRTCGIRTQQVSFACPGAKATYSFERHVTYLAAVGKVNFTAIAKYLDRAWATVNNIIERVGADLRGSDSRLDGVTRIGIGEVAYRKGHRYMVVVIDHDTGDIIWAKPGRSTQTVGDFFDQMGPDRVDKLTHVSSDAGSWIWAAVEHKAPHATLCMDTFHVMHWAG